MRRSHFLGILFLTLIIHGCEKSAEVSIGFLMPSGEGTRWVIDEEYVKAATERLGYEVIIRNANTDENLQQKQATELLEMGVDALIVVSVNSNTAAAIVRDAHDYNVPVIGYDRIILNSDLDYLVTFEGAQIGNAMVDHALKIVPTGNYVLLWGDAGDKNAIFIKDAQEKRLKPHVESGNINIVYKGFVDNWAGANAEYLMGEILDLTEQKIDAVLTSYDGLALGALNAFKEHPEQDELKVLTGQDAALDAIKSIVNDEMTLTIYKSIREIANASVELAGKLAKGEDVDDIDQTVFNGRLDVPALMLSPVAVTKNNIMETVVADEFYTREQIYED